MMLATHRQLDTHPTIVGPSRQWNDALQKAARVAATSTTVLVTGESGTGKEVLARRGAARTAARIRALRLRTRCITSADRAKPGHLELAFGGVLFLDEVGEMSLSAQAKLLRVLQEREFRRLGGTRTLQANIRVIASTNRDLRDAIEQKTFREDLFYRSQCQETTDLVSIERDLIAKILRQEHWNKARAARLLGITRTQLYCRLQKYGLTP